MAAMKPFMKHPDLFTKRLLRSDLFATVWHSSKLVFPQLPHYPIAGVLLRCLCRLPPRYTGGGGAMVFLLISFYFRDETINFFSLVDPNKRVMVGMYPSRTVP